MSFDKVLLSTLICVPLLFNYCKNGKEEIRNTKEAIPAIKSTFKEETRWDSLKISLKTVKNNEYLSINIKNKFYLQNEKYLRKKVNKFFESSKHTYILRDTNTPAYNASELTLGQLQRIYLVYKYLKDPSSLQEMGNVIEEDIKDIYAEHGGVIIFNKNRIHFKTLESCIEKNIFNNSAYKPPEEINLIPNIGGFHLHAISNNDKQYAGPSDMDLLITYITTYFGSECHEFLITPIGRGTFNIDYYGGYRIENTTTKTFDLGNYTYDTTKIK